MTASPTTTSMAGGMKPGNKRGTCLPFIFIIPEEVPMNSRLALVTITIAALAALAMTVVGQNRSYDQIMKEVGPAYANLKKNLDASAFPAAAQDAAKLEALFKETENFWMPFKTKDALDFAKNAQAGFQAVGVA